MACECDVFGTIDSNLDVTYRELRDDELTSK